MTDMPEERSALLRRIPAVHELLSCDVLREVEVDCGQAMLTLFTREVLENIRASVLDGSCTDVPDINTLAKKVAAMAGRVCNPQGRRAINATGIMLHTGLGRSPLCADALAAFDVCDGYSILQTDLETGQRSLRERKIETMLRSLTGCEAATVVNNNAAATMLILNTIAQGSEVVLSRGQLIEIGGAFRMPDVMAGSGAVLREIGTTNRTHLRDYEHAIGEETAALMHVHTSNYRVRGFSGTPSIKDIAPLAHRHNLCAVDDLGSGALVDLSDYGLASEPLVRDSIKAGADLICFSGDKLIGGPQSGIICGSKEWVARIRKNPFARMFRVCKLTLAALEVTLSHFINGTYETAIPFYRMLRMPLNELENKAQSLMARLGSIEDVKLSVEKSECYIGSGSIPDEGLESRALSIRPKNCSLDCLAQKLRTGTPSVFGRIADGALILDMRTIFSEKDFDTLVTRLKDELKGL